MVVKVKLGPSPSSMAGKVKLGPPPSSTTSKVKLSPSPSSSGWIFKASSSRHTKLVEVIDLISSDEDSDDVLSPPPSLPECHKRKAPITDCSNKKV
jgi:hypothetical protein